MNDFTKTILGKPVKLKTGLTATGQKRKLTATEPLEWKKAISLLNNLAAPEPETGNKKADNRNSIKQFENLLLFAAGFFFGLRISDILNLTWEQIAQNSEFTVFEKKTGKARTIEIPEDFKYYFKIAFKGIAEITKSIEPESYVFTNSRYDSKQPIKVHTANYRIKAVFNRYEIKVRNPSSHTLRKTFAKGIYDLNGQSEAALVELSEMLNHTNTKVTRLYIGLTKEKRKVTVSMLRR